MFFALHPSAPGCTCVSVEANVDMASADGLTAAL